jgi:predicted ATPase
LKEYELCDRWLYTARYYLPKYRYDYLSQIQACMAQVRQLEAVKIGLQALELLGIKLIEEPSPADIQQTLSSNSNKSYWKEY